MWDAKYALAKFEEGTGLKVEKVLEHRSMLWSADEKESMLTVRIAGKVHPAFIFFGDDGIRKWGYILPAAKYGLKNDVSD